eukprot:EC718892.1.p2 GENE.EC718892.1~~EC718892.1.p2  ORF type:complete len:53 (-),score=4.76 EC718892.1:170-328(-)
MSNVRRQPAIAASIFTLSKLFRPGAHNVAQEQHRRNALQQISPSALTQPATD